MATFLLAAGPPLGAVAWDQVARRLQSQGHDVLRHDLCTAEPDRARVGDHVQALAEHIDRLDAPPFVVGQGLAVPVVMGILDNRKIPGLALINGPIDTLDPFTAALSRALVKPALAAQTLLQPALFRRFLWSSLGYRRLVVNPYVMGRDTVVMVTGAAFSTAKRRQALAVFLHDLPEHLARPVAQTSAPTPTLLLWGDDDRLYPAHVADRARASFEKAEHVRIPGGRHLHIIERPWETADALDAWVWRLTGDTDPGHRDGATLT